MHQGANQVNLRTHYQYSKYQFGRRTKAADEPEIQRWQRLIRTFESAVLQACLATAREAVILSVTQLMIIPIA